MSLNISALNKQQIQLFHENGYLVLDQAVSTEQCARMRERANELVQAFDPQEVVSVFSTKNQIQTSDQYFMDSGDKIRFFMEEEAFAEDGTLVQSKEQSLNKIGHALHDLDPVFQDFSYDPALRSVVQALGLGKPQVAQSMYIFKQPNIGGEVVCHQDSTFLYTDPMSVTGLWFALEDATVENGCLWALPGGHKNGVKSRFLRTPEGGSKKEVYDDSPWPTEGIVPLEVPMGTLIVLHGSLPHLSKTNRSPKSRHAYTLHVIDGQHPYPADNWLQRSKDMPFREL